MTPYKEFSLGVDLAQDSLQVAVAWKGMDPKNWRDLPNTAIAFGPASVEGMERLRAWIKQAVSAGARCVAVVVESTGKTSQRFARAWKEAGGAPAVAIVNPRRTHALGHVLGVRDKTDRIDAAILAVYGVTQNVEPRPERGPAEERLRELTRLREAYVANVTAWESRLKETDEEEHREAIRATIDHLTQSIAKLEKRIQAVIDQDEGLGFQYRSVQQVKGIKRVIAGTLTAELGDLCQYRRGELVALAGIYPKQFTSGKSVRRRPRMAKGGGGRVRRALYNGAKSILRSKGPLRDYAEAMLRRGMNKGAVIGALMRKLLLIARAIMMNNGVYDAAKIGQQTRSTS